MAAAAEEKTVKYLVLELVDQKIQELEKKGLLPKGKGERVRIHARMPFDSGRSTWPKFW